MRNQIAIIISVIVVVFTMSFAFNVSARWTQEDGEKCTIDVADRETKNRDFFPWAEVEKIIRKIERECGVPLKNSYIVYCLEHGKFCDKAGDLVPEPNFIPSHAKSKPKAKSKPTKRYEGRAPDSSKYKDSELESNTLEAKPKPQKSVQKPKPIAPVVNEKTTVKEIHHKPVVKEIHNTTIVKKSEIIKVPKHIQTTLDGGLDYVLNNTCKFAMQGSAFIDANKDIAMKCAELWVLIKANQ